MKQRGNKPPVRYQLVYPRAQWRCGACEQSFKGARKPGVEPPCYFRSGFLTEGFATRYCKACIEALKLEVEGGDR